MKTFGLLPKKILESLQLDEQGEPIVPEGQTVVPLVKLPPPDHDALTQVPEPVLVWYADRVERRWRLVAKPPSPQPLVKTISNAQMRLWLVENGHYAAVTGYINNIADPTARLKAQIEFQSRATVERNHPLVLAVGQILGLNASELDAAFQQASLL